MFTQSTLESGIYVRFRINRGHSNIEVAQGLIMSKMSVKKIKKLIYRPDTLKKGPKINKLWAKIISDH